MTTAVRGERVLLDADLATLYGVATGALNQAVKRNLVRFPADFMFQLSIEEWAGLRSQIVTSKGIRAGMRSQFVTASRRNEALKQNCGEQFAVVFDAIKQLISDGEARKAERRIGF